MKNIFIIISILFTTTIAHAQKMYELFNGYLSPITQTGQILVNVNGVDYNAFGFTAAFNNDLGQYDGSELNSITSDVFIAVTVDGKVYELKLNSFVGGSIVQGTAIDFSNELTALPSGAAAIYVKTPKTNFPASTAGLTDELREAIDNHFKLLIDKISSSCIVRVEQSTAHAFSVGDFLTVVEEGVFEETTNSDIPNAVVVDVENQLVFSYAVCGSYNVNDFSVLGKIQWNGISDGEYVHTLVTGEQYRMFEKWGSQITIDGPYAKAINVIADNGLTSYTAPSGKLIQLGGTLNKNTEINGDNAYSIILHNNISNIVSTGSETNVGSALSHYYNNFLLSNTTDLDFSYLSQALSNMNIGSVIDESTTGDYYYQYIDFNGLEKGGLFITSDNSVGLERYIRVFGSRNSDNSIYISNKKESTNEETSIVLNYDKILLKTPNVYGATTTADQYLKLIDPVTGEVEFADIATPATTLPELTDVTITTPVNDQVLKYSNGEWVNGTFTGGTGLSSVIGVNGITTSDNGDNTYNVSLGGTLTSPTTIEGNGNSFTVNSTGSIILQNNLNSFISVEPTLTSIKGNLYQNGGDVHFQDYGDGNKLNANPAYILGVDNGGKIYEYDLANIPSTTVTQSNGLTVTQTGDNYDVKLGGQLTENTLIQGFSNMITLNSSASITLYNGSSSYISVNPLGAQINGNVLQNGGYARFSDYGGATPITGTLAKLTGFDINGQLIAIDPSSVTGASAIEDLTNVSITSLADGQILKYDQASDTWINAADATGSVGGGVTSVSAANGLTLSGTAEDPVISLGGTLTNSTTTINANGNGVSLTGASSINLSANNVFISTDAVTGSTATTGQVLKLSNSLNGEVEYADDITFANTDLTISSPRNHTMSNSTFTIQGSGSNLINLTIDPALSGLEASDYSQITGKTGLFMDTNIDNVLLYGDLVTSKGTNVFFDYGQGNKTATALSVVHNNGYMLGVADDGTVIEVTDVLSNVELTTPAEGEILTYNSLGKWVNSTLPTIDLSTSNIGDLGNVTISGVKDEQLLQYNSGTSLWENVDFLLGSIPNVNISTPLDGQVLKYDQASNTWINGPDNTGIGTGSNQTLSIDNATAVLTILDGNSVDLSEAIDNQVNTLFTDGTNILSTYDDISNTLTVRTTDALTQIDAITFDNNVTDAVTSRMQYNADVGTFVIGAANNVPIKVGQDVVWYVKNNTASTIPKGTAVMAVGADGNSGIMLIDEMVFDGSVDAKYFLGVTAEEITSTSNGTVISQGTLKGYDTSLIPANTVLYGDPTTPGGFTTTEPTGTNLKLPIANTLSQTNNGTIAIRVHTGLYVKDLHDVDITGIADNSILKYNNTSGNWEIGTDLEESTTASNGLTLSGTDVKLGGTLSDNTVIYTNGKGLYLGETDNAVGIAISQPNDILRLYGFTLLESYGNGTQLVTGHSTDDSPGFSPYTYLLGVNTSGGIKEVPAELNALSDVVISTPATNQALIYNGTDWVNAALPSGSSTLASLTDTDLTGVVSGNVLKYNGTTWIPSNDNSESTTASNGLTKVGFDVRLGGTLSQSTNIELSSHDLSLVSGAAGTGILIQPTSLLTTLFGRQRFSIYGNGNTEAIDLGLTASDYIAGFSTDGTLIEVPISSLGSASTLNDLTDVNAPTPSDGNVLKYNGTTWVPGTDNVNDADASASNEGSLTVAAGATNTSVINSNTSGSTGVTLATSTGLTISESGNTITLTNSLPEATTASNGLTQVGNDIQLGGSVLDPVEILTFNELWLRTDGVNGEVLIGSKADANYLSKKQSTDYIEIKGNQLFSSYGIGEKEATDLTKTESNYVAAFATDGTLIEVNKNTLSTSVSGGNGINVTEPTSGNYTVSLGNLTESTTTILYPDNGYLVFDNNSQDGAGLSIYDGVDLIVLDANVRLLDYGAGNKIEATAYPIGVTSTGFIRELDYSVQTYTSASHTGVEIEGLKLNILTPNDRGISIYPSTGNNDVLIAQKAHSIKNQTSTTVDFENYAQKIIKIDLSAAGSNVSLSLSGGQEGGIYTIHFINAAGKTINWPTNAYDETVSLKANDTITGAGKMFTMYYDGTNYYVK